MKQEINRNRKQQSKLWMALSAFTMLGAGQRTSLIGLRAYCHTAFTMAEILLSLTIIGVVAAITLPSLTGNINERTWNTQRKALYSRMSQAVALMPALNGYGTSVDNAAETFVTSGLSKVLKINNICNGEHLGDCGLPDKIIPYNNTPMTFPTKWSELNPKMVSTAWMSLSFSMEDAPAAAFETANGESIAVYYNSQCKADMNEVSFYLINSKVCANLLYDLNGKKGPNTLGKDIGWITIFYPNDSLVVAPSPAPSLQSTTNVDWQTATTLCKNYEEGYRLPNREEAASIFVNKNLLPSFVTVGSHENIWTSTKSGANYAYHMYIAGGVLGTLHVDNTAGDNAWCVKR